MIDFSLNSIASLADNQFAQGGLFIGIVTSIFYSLKPLPGFIYQRIVTYFTFKVDVSFSNRDSAYEYFSEWYAKRFPSKFKNTVASIKYDQADYFDSSPKPMKLRLSFAQGSDINLIWYSGRLLYIRKRREKLEHANDVSEVYTNEYSVSGIFAKKAIIALFEEIMRTKQDELNKSYGLNLIYGIDKYKKLENFKTFDNLFFNGKDDLISYIDSWHHRREKSKEMGIIHKTGISLYGPPGTGKTSIAKAIAHRHSMNLVLVNLSTFNKDQDLLNYINAQTSPSIFLFEDVDEFLGKSKRSNLDGKSTVSFSGILQILDGVNSPDNSIFILTTNLINELDPALYRDGRINMRLEIGLPDNQNIQSFVNKYFDSGIVIPNHIPNKLPMANVEQILLNSNSADEAVDSIVSKNAEYLT
jgi:chaperone BCS1